jgi:High-affinity nickel-transport protein
LDALDTHSSSVLNTTAALSVTVTPIKPKCDERHSNVLMVGAYGRAFMKPVRKLYYNMTVTCVSVVVAIVIGGIEVLGLAAGRSTIKEASGA